MNPKGREVLLAEAAAGNRLAQSFLTDLFAACDVADDIEDEEKKSGRVESVLASLLALHSNPFYRANADALAALMHGGLLCWAVANELEGAQAAFYAAAMEQVIFYVALVCGGREHAKRVALKWIASSTGNGNGMVG